jgi:LPS sulfotransferase NodH
MTAAPFFIVGCGRSGTTLLRTILNAHSELAIPLESLFIVDYLAAGEKLSREEMLDLLLREPEIREWGLKPRRADFEGALTPVQAIDRLHRLYCRMQSKSRWGQKTPRFVRHLDLIALCFPGARFIHVVRDPRAVASSLIRSEVHQSNAWHAAGRWRRDVSAGLLFEEGHRDAVLRIHYEHLVTDPAGTLEEIARFLEIEPEAGMLDGMSGRREYSRFYREIHANLDRPPTAAFVNRWREDLDEMQVEIVESVAGDLMERTGYQPESSRTAPPGPGLLQNLRPLGLLRQAGQYARHRRAYLVHLLRRKWRLGTLGGFLRTVQH